MPARSWSHAVRPATRRCKSTTPHAADNFNINANIIRSQVLFAVVVGVLTDNGVWAFLVFADIFRDLLVLLQIIVVLRQCFVRGLAQYLRHFANYHLVLYLLLLYVPHHIESRQLVHLSSPQIVSPLE